MLHRGCNSRFGKLEQHRNWAYDGLVGVSISDFATGCAAYTKTEWEGNPIHPTFKTPDEKVELRKKRAKVAYLRKKNAKT